MTKRRTWSSCSGSCNWRGTREVLAYTDPLEFLEACRVSPPDLVLLDLQMPALDGFSVLERMKRSVIDFDYRPVMIITREDDRRRSSERCRAGRATFSPSRSAPWRSAFGSATCSIPVSSSAGSSDTPSAWRTTWPRGPRNSRKLGRRCWSAWRWPPSIGTMPPASTLAGSDGNPLRSPRRSGFRRTRSKTFGARLHLHDLGKIATPDEILLKEGSLTEVEMETVGSTRSSGRAFSRAAACGRFWSPRRSRNVTTNAGMEAGTPLD